MSSLEDAVVETKKGEKDSKYNTGNCNIANPLRRVFRIRSLKFREFLAEIFGTFLLCVFGMCAIAQAKFSQRDDANQTNPIPVTICFGFGVTLAIIVVGKVSGAHLNPAVSLAFLITGRMSVSKFIIYTLAQMIGAFLGAATVFLAYYDQLKALNGDMFTLDTAGIFVTLPSKNLSLAGGFFDQVLGTALLIIAIMSLTDKNNAEIPHAGVAVLVGLFLIIIINALGYNCGGALNPARDFAPRVFTAIAGWGSQMFTTGNYFFWIPILGPLVGAVVGTLMYLLLVSIHWVEIKENLTQLDSF